MSEISLTYDPATRHVLWECGKAQLGMPYDQIVRAGGVGKISWLSGFLGCYGGRHVVIRSNLPRLNLHDVLYGPRIAKKKIHRYFRMVQE